MLNGLVTSNGSTKGVALHGVVFRHVERGFCTTNLLPGKQYGGAVLDISDSIPAFTGLANKGGSRVAEGQCRVRTTRVKRLHRLAADTTAFKVDEIKTDAGLICCRHDRKAGNVAISDADLGAGEAIRTHGTACA